MLLRCSKLCEVTLAPGKLSWPWVAFAPERTAFAFPNGARSLAIRANTSLGEEQRVELPQALGLPTASANHSATTSRQPGLHAIALHPDGRTIVGLGWHDDIPVACVERVGGVPELIDLGPALGDLGPLAATFTRDGESIWVSAESAAGAAVARLAFRDFGLMSKVAFAPAPPPAAHELFLHPIEDAVVLTMACGEDGTFVRVVRMVGERLELVAGEGDGGLPPCGIADATDDGHLLCFVASDEVQLRRWPDLSREVQVDIDDEQSANYSGVRIAGRFIVSATLQDDGDEERALVLSDVLKLEDDAPAPPGMWAGRLGLDRLVTIGRDKGDERKAFVYAIEL